MLHEGLEEYQHTVDQAATISDLVSLKHMIPFTVVFCAPGRTALNFSVWIKQYPWAIRSHALLL